MRQILVNHARHHGAAKRGGGNRVALEEGAAVVEQGEVDLIALDEALDKLAQLDPRQSRIVELTEVEIAEVLASPPSTSSATGVSPGPNCIANSAQASWRGRMS